MNRWKLGSQEYYLDHTLIALILVISLNTFVIRVFNYITLRFL